MTMLCATYLPLSVIWMTAVLWLNNLARITTFPTNKIAKLYKISRKKVWGLGTISFYPCMNHKQPALVLSVSISERPINESDGKDER